MPMPPFELDFRPNLHMVPSSVMGDIARDAWAPRMPIDRPPTGAPLDRTALSEIFKNASNVEFSTSDLNKLSGKQPDFFLDKGGQLVKNPYAPPNPDGKLNIEIQFNGAMPGDPQKSSVQQIADAFMAGHPDLTSFPRTWQEVFQQILQRLSNLRNDASSQQGDGGAGGRPASRPGGGGGGGRDGGGGGGGGTDYGAGARCEPGGNDRVQPAAARWDGQSRGDMNLVELSESAIGHALWNETRFAGDCRNGSVGCAASVTKILQAGNYSYADSASVIELAGQLGQNGWTESGVDGVQPGDVIYGNGGGTKQHIGIVGVDENGELVIYNNHSSDGQWHKDKWHECSIISDYLPGQIKVLHPPGGTTMA